MIIAMGSFLKSQRRKHVVIEVPRAIAHDAEFEIRVTNRAYDEMAVSIFMDGEKVVSVKRDGQIEATGS